MNVILITVDALRADHLSRMGYSRETTPYLDNIAEENAFFSRAFSTGPTTQFSFPSIMASLYPLMLNGLGLPKNKGKTIAEVLKEYGYDTAAMHSNGYLSSSYNYDRGFDTFLDPENWSSKLAPWKQRLKSVLDSYPGIYHHIKKVGSYFFGGDLSFTYRDAGEITDKALSWISDQDDNYFLWLHYMDVHHPFYPHKEFIQKFDIEGMSVGEALRVRDKLLKDPYDISNNVKREELEQLMGIYDTEIAYVDKHIKRLLKRGQISNDTTVIVTSDHGEEFGEHGGFHRMKPYNEMLNVPLIIKSQKFNNGIEISEPVSLIDLAPTILDLIGIEPIKCFQGQSLLGFIERERESGGVFSEYYPKIVEGDSSDAGKTFVYQNKSHKYIYSEENDEREEMYDLNEDPGESKNIVKKDVKTKRKLKKKIIDHMENIKSNDIPVEDKDMNEKVERNLKGLGYL